MLLVYSTESTANYFRSSMYLFLSTNQLFSILKKLQITYYFLHNSFENKEGSTPFSFQPPTPSATTKSYSLA
jgi:hypothetical protein